MKILIFGATGFIGKELIEHLIEKNEIYIVSRNPEKAKKILPKTVITCSWNYHDIVELTWLINGKDIIINLAGQNIASGLWTKKQKDKILNSRVNIGKQISKAIIESNVKPKLLIQASATGFYGHSASQLCDESSPKGKGFLATVTEKWEKSTEEITNYGVNRAIIRTGVVLGKKGGMLPRVSKPIQYFLGSNFGKGNNWVSWIHVKDEIKAIEFIISNQPSNSIYNLVAPEPVQSKRLNSIIAKSLNRPIWFNIPKIILLFLLGDMAQELMLSSQNIFPKKLIEDGYKFQFPDAEDAVQSLLKKRPQ